MDKLQQLNDFIDLTKDPELTIFKAVKVVSDKLDTLEQNMMENSTQIMAEMTPETDVQPICDKLDTMMAKMNEPMVIKLKII